MSRPLRFVRSKHCKPAQNGGVSASAIKPINITEAIARLSSSDNFPSAKRDYDFLSNICHHNGSSHQLFHASMRETNTVMLPSGVQIAMKTPCPAVTLEYPPKVAYRASIAQTSRLALACTSWVDTLVKEMPLVPFSDEEVATLTDGELKDSLNYHSPRYNMPAEQIQRQEVSKVRRNDPCPCGLGKKFKKCCMGVGL